MESWFLAAVSCFPYAFYICIQLQLASNKSKLSVQRVFPQFIPLNFHRFNRVWFICIQQSGIRARLVCACPSLYPECL